VASRAAQLASEQPAIGREFNKKKVRHVVVKRIAAIVFVYLFAAFGWMVLGGTITYRTDTQDSELRRQVGELWGKPLTQQAPVGTLFLSRSIETKKWDASAKRNIVETETVIDKFEVPIVENDIRVDLELDQRQKGLLWYSTYRVRFNGSYVFENQQSKAGELNLIFHFPTTNGQYDEFVFDVDGRHVAFTRENNDQIVAKVACEPGSRHTLVVNYRSQGLDCFVYKFGQGITEIRNFNLVTTTDFDGYDHPGDTLSPGRRERRDRGWQLTWTYSDLISGSGIGIETPQKINPGPLAARISFFAPVSLGFFFFLIFIISALKRIEIHPMNYFFLAASFFAFHLLLAYMVDHVPLLTAFVVCSVVSIFLVVSYMRLVVGKRFAYMETALTQLVYLVGFSYAFFFEGFTGLAITIGSIITLFVVMQLTARINWSERFQLREAKQPAIAE
jgi:hypothetical protein